MAADHDGDAPVRLRRYLPLAVLASGLVIVLPAMVVTAIVPRGSVLLMAASAASAVAVSVAIASAEAALWKRRPRSRDILFADLMLWGWLRRCWTERRLTQARALYDSARRAGPTVSIELLAGLSRLLEARDVYTHGHSQRVARHAERIASAMRLSPVEIAKVRTAAAVHDVGKLYTPREILNNPGRLNDAEFTVMKRHAADGADMLAAVGDPEITAMVRHHHERMDGRGYPDGLVGSDIPLGARIVAVADTFDSITSNRAYRRAGTQKKALDILSKETGSQLDPVAVAAFAHRYSARRSVAWFAFAAAAPQRILAGLRSTSASVGANLGGVSSILPALGAAGLLTLLPGLHRDTPVNRNTSLGPVITRSHQLTIPTTLTTHTGQTTHTQPASPNRHQSHRTVRSAPSAPVSSTPTASTPNAPAAGSSTGDPVAGAPTPAPTTSSPTPVPPTTALPVNEVPTLPTPPISPPVAIPGVTLPPVHVPSVPLPSLAIPTTEVPSTNIPSLG